MPHPNLTRRLPDDKDRHTCAVGYELGAAAITTGGKGGIDFG